MVNGATAKCRMDRPGKANKINSVKQQQDGAILPGSANPWGQT